MSITNGGSSPVVAPALSSSAIKFGRSYQMAIWANNSTPASPNTVFIDFPITLTFDVTHHIFAEANVANFSLTNLSASKRNLLAYNRVTKSQAYNITLRAGYTSQQPFGFQGNATFLPQIFNGYVNVGYTERSGPDLITRINAFDNGDIANGKPMGYVAPNSPNKEVLSYVAPKDATFAQMVEALTNKLDPTFGTIKFGGVYVTNPPPNQSSVRPRTYNGTAWNCLHQLVSEANGAQLFIENGVLYVLGQNDTIPASSSIPVLNSSTGLLDIPKYDGYNILVRTIFEPSWRIGAQVLLQSQYADFGNTGSGLQMTQGYSAVCKVIGYTHRGTISGVESGELSTELTLLKTDMPTGNAQL